MQAAGLRKQLAPESQRIGAGHAAAEQDGEQLGVRQRGAASLQEFFAGAFPFWPVSNAHSSTMPQGRLRVQRRTQSIPVS